MSRMSMLLVAAFCYKNTIAAENAIRRRSFAPCVKFPPLSWIFMMNTFQELNSVGTGHGRKSQGLVPPPQN